MQLLKNHKLAQLGISMGLLLIVGCSTTSATQTSPSPSPTNPAEPIEISQNGSNFTPDANNPNYLRDYEPTAALPQTGKVTIRRSIRELDTSNLFTSCPTDTAPYAYAESTHYQVLICSAEFDPSVPQTYIGAAKDGSGTLTITSEDETAANQLIFKSNGYTYSIYRDGARPELLNAYLEVTQPDGKTYAEALLYLYHFRP